MTNLKMLKTVGMLLSRSRPGAPGQLRGGLAASQEAL